MYVDVKYCNLDSILPYVTFAYNTTAREATRRLPFRLVRGREVLTMLDSMLLHEESTVAITGAEEIALRADVMRKTARRRIRQQPANDAQLYNLHSRYFTYATAEQVWVWSRIRRGGHSDKLPCRYFGPYKGVNRTSDMNPQVLPGEPVRLPC